MLQAATCNGWMQCGEMRNAMLDAGCRTPILLTCAEAARSLGVSVRTIKNWARARAFPVVRLSNRIVRIRVADLESFVERARRRKQHVNVQEGH